MTNLLKTNLKSEESLLVLSTICFIPFFTFSPLSLSTFFHLKKKPQPKTLLLLPKLSCCNNMTTSQEERKNPQKRLG